MPVPKTVVTVHYEKGHPTGLSQAHKLAGLIKQYGQPTEIVGHMAYWTYAVANMPPRSISCRINNTFRKTGKVTKLTIPT